MAAVVWCPEVLNLGERTVGTEVSYFGRTELMNIVRQKQPCRKKINPSEKKQWAAFGEDLGSNGLSTADLARQEKSLPRRKK